MASDLALGLQLQVRQNAAELQDFLRDLDNWETDIKQKDEELTKSKLVDKKIVPPVRNARKKKKKHHASENHARTIKTPQGNEKTRLNSYDYRGWDKFDVDKVLKDMDEDEEMETISSSSDESQETDEELELERKAQCAALEKDKGNELFKKGQYEEAISCYSTGLQLDPSNAVLPANRAMALLKMEKYGAAEADCSLAISLDDTYTKAYLRRAAARSQLGKLTESMADYEQVLRLESGNKQATEELHKVKEKLGIKEEQKSPASKASKEERLKGQRKTRLKQPLKRVVIEEVGSDSSEDECPATIEPTPVQTLGHATSATPTCTSQGRDECITVTSTHHNEQQTAALSKRPDIHKVSGCSVASQSAAPLVSNSTDVTQNLSPSRPFPVPKTSMQFMADWRVLHKTPAQQCQYLQALKPEMYTKLFQQSLESDVLMGILTILHDYYIPEKRPLYEELKCLTQVKRFGMALMFLSSNEKKVLEDLFVYLRQDRESSGSTSDADINELSKKYGVS